MRRLVIKRSVKPSTYFLKAGSGKTFGQKQATATRFVSIHQFSRIDSIKQLREEQQAYSRPKIEFTRFAFRE